MKLFFGLMDKINHHRPLDLSLSPRQNVTGVVDGRRNNAFERGYKEVSSRVLLAEEEEEQINELVLEERKRRRVCHRF